MWYGALAFRGELIVYSLVLLSIPYDQQRYWRLFRKNNIEPCTYMLIIRSGEGLYNDVSTREHGASYYYVSNT